MLNRKPGDTFSIKKISNTCSALPHTHPEAGAGESRLVTEAETCIDYTLELPLSAHWDF